MFSVEQGKLYVYSKKELVSQMISIKKSTKPRSAVIRKKVDDFNALGHLAIGTFLGLFFAHTPLEFAYVLLGSLLIDIDHSRSTMGRWNPFTKRWMPRRVRWKHRGHCHTFLGAILLSAPFLVVDLRAFFLVFVGCMGHLLGDKFLSIFPKHDAFKLKFW